MLSLLGMALAVSMVRGRVALGQPTCVLFMPPHRRLVCSTLRTNMPFYPRSHPASATDREQVAFVTLNLPGDVTTEKLDIRVMWSNATANDKVSDPPPLLVVRV